MEKTERETNHVDKPRNFEINFYDDYKQITRSWYSIVNFVPLLLIALVFGGVWIGNDFLEILTSDKSLPLKAFSLLFFGIGIFAAYYTVATFFNRTEIFVNRDTIEIKHRPIPWYGNRKIEVSNISSLLVETKYKGSGNYKRGLHFNILGLTKEGESLKIMTRFQNKNQASFIKQEIENYLGIEKQEGNATEVV